MSGFDGYGNGYGNGGRGNGNGYGNGRYGNGNPRNGYGNNNMDLDRFGGTLPGQNSSQVRRFRPMPLPPDERPRYRRGGGLLGSLLGAAAVSTSSGAMLNQQDREQRMRREQLIAERQRQMELQQRHLNQGMPQQMAQPQLAVPQQEDGVLPNGRRICKNCGMIVTGNFCEFCGSAL